MILEFTMSGYVNLGYTVDGGEGYDSRADEVIELNGMDLDMTPLTKTIDEYSKSILFELYGDKVATIGTVSSTLKWITNENDFTIEGVFAFDDFGKLPVIEHDVLVSRLVSATTDLFGADIDRIIDVEPLLEEIGYDLSIYFRIDGVDDVTATIKETR
jgi:hypothetical protein